MLVPKVQLIPTPEQVSELLGETGALREGHFEFPTGLHSGHYFQMPRAMISRQRAGFERCFIKTAAP